MQKLIVVLILSVWGGAACAGDVSARRASANGLYGDTLSPAERLGAAAMRRGETRGILELWYNTGDARYFNYLQQRVDSSDRADSPGDKDGRVLLMLYRVTGQEKYRQAAALLWSRLRERRRTGEESYNSLPFLAEYTWLFHADSVFDEIAGAFQAGSAQSVRGGYAAALVDALDYIPAGHPGRQRLITLLKRCASVTPNVSDASAGCWWIYALARGVRMGYLPARYRGAAEKNWRDIQGRGWNTIVGSGAGEVGGLLLAAEEMALQPANGKKVLLDYWFNNERRKDVTGAQVRYHYTWEDMANSGYSIWGHLFQMQGAHIDSLPVAPTPGNLKNASVYIITDPDNEKESTGPHYPTDADGEAIENWVRAGGVLVLMSNDSANCEFPHFNHLAERFGVHFDFDDYHKVTGSDWAMGAFVIPAQDAIFGSTKKIYIKELSTLTLSGPAQPVFTDNGRNIMAVARLGKGAVFAVGDPWFYNEYTDGRKLPKDYENYNAARDLVHWLLKTAAVPAKKN